jgi:hypothetical protein
LIGKQAKFICKRFFRLYEIFALEELAAIVQSIQKIIRKLVSDLIRADICCASIANQNQKLKLAWAPEKVVKKEDTRQFDYGLWNFRKQVSY